MRHARQKRTQIDRCIVTIGVAGAVLTWQKRLPIETDYAAEVAVLRRKYSAVGQVMALENHGGARDLATLVGRLWSHIAATGLDAVLIAVDPGDAAFYGRIGFRPTGWPRRRWLLADNAEVEAMVLDVAEAAPRARGILERLRAASAAGRSGERKVQGAMK